MSGPESFRLVVRTVLPGLWLSRRSEMCNKSWRTTNRTEMEDHFRASLEPVLSLAEELGVQILIEPEPALLAENGSHVTGLLRELASAAIGLNFDAGHSFCAGQDTRKLLSDEKKIAGGIIARQEKRHTRCCVILGSPRGELHPGGRSGRESDQSRGRTTSDDLNLNRRVRQEEGRTPAGVVQQSQWAGGSWE